MTKNTLIGPFRQLLSMAGLPLKGALSDHQLEIIENAGLVFADEKVVATGKYHELKKRYAQAERVSLEGDQVCMPGFIDAHTHICFGGSRANDYALRNAGISYLEIAKAGGGIQDTVAQTRKASKEELVNRTAALARRHLNNGITTLEVKSGYGLTIAHELKMLRAIKEASSGVPCDLIPTCLAAHMLPKDYDGTAAEYLDEVSRALFPVLKEEKLSRRVDAFIEESAFSSQQIKPFFEKARQMGFDITVHADQFTTGGSQVAVEFEAVSADHLEVSTQKEIENLAGSETIATALPGASIGLGCGFTPARKLLDAGAALAIASDHNPGSAPMGDLLMQAAVLGAFEKLSNAEVLAGITTRAAAALKLKDRGSLAAGQLADFNVFQTDNYQDILYHQGTKKPCMVWKKGEVAYDKRNNNR